jgi:dihydrolipoamide dehydrogenase
MQGIHVVNKILGKTDSIRFDVMPAAVFSYPEVAFVGKSEDDCRAEDLECRCRKAFYRANGKALAMDETEGLLKLLSDSSDRIIGCHVYGAHAADIVQEVAVLMNYNATVAQLRDIVHIHPTLSEILQSAAEMP